MDRVKGDRSVRAIVKGCANWTEVRDRTGAPTGWRDDSSNFDFNYRDRFGDTTREEIAERLEKGALQNGFSFLYRHSDAATFAANFNQKGNFNNVEDKEGMADLMDSSGG